MSGQSFLEVNQSGPNRFPLSYSASNNVHRLLHVIADAKKTGLPGGLLFLMWKKRLIAWIGDISGRSCKNSNSVQNLLKRYRFYILIPLLELSQLVNSPIFSAQVVVLDRGSQLALHF